MKTDFSGAVFERSFGTAEELPRSDIPEIVLSGKSNVGKSSLINRVLGKKAAARVSKTPGKTATVNFYRAGGVRLVDLPGYGYARVPAEEKLRWGELVEGYFHSDRRIAMVLQLVDMRNPLSVNDRDMVDFLREMRLPFAVVLTKSDKLNKTGYTARLGGFKSELVLPDGTDVIPFSAVTGEGTGAVRAILKKYGA